MFRWIKRGVVVVVGSLAFAIIFGSLYQWNATRKDLRATPAPGRMVDVGGYKLHMWCEGSGTPAVVLDTGLGGSAADWGYVQPQVAKFTRVCSYDRAGMGYSDPGPMPRTSRQISEELSRLIQNSGIDAPVVLVGASLGGLHVRAFTYEHPISVVSAGVSEESQARVQVWNGLQRSQASLSSRGCQVIARKSRHVIQIEEPDIVVNAIRQLVDQSRTGIPRSCEFTAAAQ